MKTFKTTFYKIQSDKLKTQSIRLAVLSDLHNVELGKENENLLGELKEQAPDAILIAGDLVLGKEKASFQIPYAFLKEAVHIAPVYYALGNHEQRMKRKPEVYGEGYLGFEKRVGKLGVVFLENETRELEVRGEKILISGLLPPYKYYKKGGKDFLKSEEIEALLGKPSKNQFQVLLAHTPKYGDSYLEWGSDVTFSGHYHGGMVQLPFLGGVISPDFRIFPKYCKGHFQEGDRHLIVSGGLGEHTIPLRIFNPRELIIVECSPKKISEK